MCMKATQAECPSVNGKEVAVGTTWFQYKFKWADFTKPADAVPGPVDPKQLARIDLLFVIPAMSTTELFITEIKLATAAELQ